MRRRKALQREYSKEVALASGLNSYVFENFHLLLSGRKRFHTFRNGSTRCGYRDRYRGNEEFNPDGDRQAVTTTRTFSPGSSNISAMLRSGIIVARDGRGSPEVAFDSIVPLLMAFARFVENKLRGEKLKALPLCLPPAGGRVLPCRREQVSCR
jgi:hypothetical protein